MNKLNRALLDDADLKIKNLLQKKEILLNKVSYKNDTKPLLVGYILMLIILIILILIRIL